LFFQGQYPAASKLSTVCRLSFELYHNLLYVLFFIIDSIIDGGHVG
jgi:hypothetical protein